MNVELFRARQKYDNSASSRPSGHVAAARMARGRTSPPSEGAVDGRLIHSELLPDVADGRDHEWAQQVAVSKRTFKAVALRETRDGEPGAGTLQRVLELPRPKGADAAGSDCTSSRLRGSSGAVGAGRRAP